MATECRQPTLVGLRSETSLHTYTGFRPKPRCQPCAEGRCPFGASGSRSSAQQLLDRGDERTFDLWRDIRGGRTRFVAALLVGNGGGDVPRRVISIRRHRNEQI